MDKLGKPRFQIYLGQSHKFDECLERFVENHKPDRLVTQQLQSLYLEWEDINECDDNEDQDGVRDKAISSRDDGYIIQGVFTITSEFVTLKLHTKCTWSHYAGSDDIKNNNSNRDGSQSCQMNISIHASSAFTPKSLWTKLKKKGNDNTERVDRKEKKIQDKIRAGKIERMRKDDYIQKLAGEDPDSTTNTKKAASANPFHGPLLCEASVQFDLTHPEIICDGDTKSTPPSSSSLSITNYRMDNLEERVYSSDDILEAIRRAVFSQMDETLSVMEILLMFPYLPDEECVCRQNVDDEYNWIGVVLRERAVLRILEDAMFDQCEKEGENDMLGSLNIGQGQGEIEDLRDKTKSISKAIEGTEKKKIVARKRLKL